MTNCVFESLKAGLRPLDFKFIFALMNLRVTTLKDVQDAQHAQHGGDARNGQAQLVDDKSVILDHYFTSNQKFVELLQLVAHYTLATTRAHSMAHVVLNDEPKKPTDLYGMAHFCYNVAHQNLLQSYLEVGYYNSGHDDNLLTLVCYATQITICVLIESTKVIDVYKHHNSTNPHQIDLSFSDSHCAFLKRT